MSPLPPFANLPAIATHVRATLDGPANMPEKAKRFVLLYGHNGVGKTQLSMAIKNIGRQEMPATRCTLTPIPKTYLAGTTIWLAITTASWFSTPPPASLQASQRWRWIPVSVRCCSAMLISIFRSMPRLA